MLCLCCSSEVDNRTVLSISCAVDPEIIDIIMNHYPNSYTCFYIDGTYPACYFCSIQCMSLHLIRYGRIFMDDYA